MNNKGSAVSLAVTAAFIALIASACSSGKATTPALTTSTPSGATSQTVPITADITALLGKSSSVSSIKYDMLTTVGSTQSTATVWLKANKMKMQFTQGTTTVVNIIDNSEQTVITYFVGQTYAYQSAYTQPQSPVSYSNSITSYSPTVVGSETVNGYSCTVIQYVTGGTTTKAWIWNEHGIVVRMESAKSSGPTTVIEFKNIDLSAIDDSVFQLPAGVILMTEPEMG